MINLDKHLSDAFANAVRRSRLATLIASVGASHVIWFMLGAAYAIGWAFSLGVGIVTWFLVPPWLVTLGIEYAVRRRRPFQVEKKQPLIQMLMLTPSFPSGHATVSFACATAAYYLPEQLHVLFPLFLLAAVYVSLSRVAVGVHYFSDIIAGALIGIVVPYALTYLFLLSL